MRYNRVVFAHTNKDAAPFFCFSEFVLNISTFCFASHLKRKRVNEMSIRAELRIYMGRNLRRNKTIERKETTTEILKSRTEQHEEDE